MLEVKECSFSYPPSNNSPKNHTSISGKPILKDLSFQVAAGKTTALLGPSGCGKTTLVHLIADLIPPVEGRPQGRISLEGTSIRKGDARVGLMPQHYGLLPWFSAGKNLELGLILRKVPKALRRVRCAEAAERFGIAGLLHRYPGSLSGGEQQRVAIARLLVTQPQLLLLDEPFSSLDALTREELQEYLLSAREPEVSILLVTHSIEEAAFLADSVIILTPEGGGQELSLPNRSGDRNSSIYYLRCSAIRSTMEELWG